MGLPVMQRTSGNALGPPNHSRGVWLQLFQRPRKTTSRWRRTAGRIPERNQLLRCRKLRREDVVPFRHASGGQSTASGKLGQSPIASFLRSFRLVLVGGGSFLPVLALLCSDLQRTSRCVERTRASVASWIASRTVLDQWSGSQVGLELLNSLQQLARASCVRSCCSVLELSHFELH